MTTLPDIERLEALAEKGTPGLCWAVAGMSLPIATKQCITNAEILALCAMARRGLASPRGEAVAWQPIETAPRDGTEILCCTAGQSTSVEFYRWLDGGWLTRMDYYDPDKPLTHWMLLEVPDAE